MGSESEAPEDAGDEDRDGLMETYFDFMNKAAPDRVCHVCGHDTFVAFIGQRGPQIFRMTIPEEDRRSVEQSSEPGLDCLAHYCERCGTVTFTLKRLVEDRAHADI